MTYIELLTGTGDAKMIDAAVEGASLLHDVFWIGLCIVVFNYGFFTLLAKVKKQRRLNNQTWNNYFRASQQQQNEFFRASQQQYRLSTLLNNQNKPAKKIEDKTRERIFKLYKLAKVGVGGEKDNAKIMYLKILDKNSLSQEEFLTEYKTHGDERPNKRKY